MESLLVSHPFVDGNKRAAFTTFEVLLRIYGHAVTADDITLYAAILKWLALPS
ncbi:MAG: Fic family protein [Desulfovibrio sp.]|nr:Fic family protein [Desulfovibrio sp.]